MQNDYPIDEEFITLSEAAKLCPTRPTPSTIWRWVHYGLKSKKLDTWKLGGRRMTTKEALFRFLFDAPAATGSVKTDTRNQVGSFDDAERMLDQEGV